MQNAPRSHAARAGCTFHAGAYAPCPMNGIPRLLIAFCLLAALCGGCSKKARDEDHEEEPATTPAAKPAAAAPKPGASSAPSAAEEKASRTAAASPPDTDRGAIPADLAAADAAYEAWFKKYNLDLTDPKMLDEDPDSDGFTNREEFLADTNPRDPNSRPGVAKGMRLKEFVRKDLPFVLKAVQGDSAQIDRDDEGAKRSETVKAGQTLRGSPYRVARVQSRPMTDKDGHPVDASRVTLEDPSTKQRVELIKDLPTRSTESHAVLVSTDGKQSITVHEGETFTWPGEPPLEYKVKDLRAEQVILEEVNSKKMVTVPKQE
jgi:hypothetical protein